MRSVIIYQSIHHQNTEKIAQVIAEVLDAKIIKPPEINPVRNSREILQFTQKLSQLDDLTSNRTGSDRGIISNGIKAEEINNYDLIGFGSGVYFGQYHRTLVDFVKKLPRFESKKAFIFSTSGRAESAFFNLFTRNFRKLLKSKGFNLVGTFNCLGYDTFGWLKIIGGLNRGRPNEGDLEKAKEFAKNLWNHN